MNIIESNYRQIKFIDIKNNGIMEECAVMKIFENGDIAFIPIANLDMTDKQRLLKVISSEYGHMFDLHELLKNSTLKNGMNGLEYFQQLVKVLTPSGQIIDVSANRRGAIIKPQNTTSLQEDQNVLKKKKNLTSEVPTK